MNRETRRAPGSEIRLSSDDEGHRYIDVRLITPGVVDDYGSLWMADAFDDSIAKRMPTLTWGHDWSEPIGRAVAYTPSEDGPTARFRFDDPDAVPLVRRAISQVESGTLDDVSVGFSNTRRRQPTDAERARFPGIVEVIERANLDETALVLRGAVPGAKVLSLRTAAGTVDGDTVLGLARQIAAGDLTQEEALAALNLAAAAEAPADAPNGVPDEPDDDGADEVLAEADAALDAALRSSRV